MVKRYRRKKSASFENNPYIGAYADFSFDIISETQLGEERITFETRLHYYEQGSGEPLLLLHGIGQSLFTWRRNIDFFASRGFRVIAPDLIGFGYSGHADIYNTIEENAIIIGAFLDALKIKCVHIAGVSTGALSAACFAAAYPKRVKKIVLISPGGPNENYPFLLRFLTTRLGALCFRTMLSETTFRKVLSDFYFNATLLTDKAISQYYEPFTTKDVRETLIRTMVHFDDTTANLAAKSIMSTVLVFSGADDHHHTEADILAFSRKLRYFKHIRLRNCGQNVHEEKPSKFNEQVLLFLQSDSDGIWS